MSAAIPPVAPAAVPSALRPALYRYRAGIADPIYRLNSIRVTKSGDGGDSDNFGGLTLVGPLAMVGALPPYRR